MKLEVIDLCGHFAPYATTDLDFIAEQQGLGCNDIEYILNMIAEGAASAYIGEIEYRKVLE